MDTSTLAPPAQSAPAGPPPGPTPATGAPRRTARTGLGAEVRESLMLLGFATGVTVGLTAAAQAALVLLS